MKTFDGLAELRAAAGTHLGRSEWFELDQERVNVFADATDDHQWIHVDAERAATGPFGATVAHGYLILSLLPGLCRQVFSTNGLAMEVNYGLNKVRFPAPAVLPCRIRADVELLSVHPSVAADLATMKVTITTDNGGKPLCVAECVGYLVPA